MGLQDLLKAITPAAASQVKHSTKSISTHLDHNAKSQAVNTRGTPDEAPTSSLFFNPAKTQEAEKFDLLQAFLVRARAVVQIASNVHLAKWLGLEFLPKIQLHAPLAVQPQMALVVASITDTMLKAKSELGAARVLIKDMLVNGFKVDRYAEPLAIQTKAQFVKAESVIHHEAPAVFHTGTVVGTNALTKIDVADIHEVAGKELIQRLANLYGLETDMLVALVQTAIAIKGGSIQIDSVGDITLNATGTLNLNATNIKLHAAASIEMGANLAISAQTQTLTMHGVAAASMLSTGVAAVSGTVGCLPFGMAPVPPIRPDLLATIPPVPPVLTGLLSPDVDVRESDMVEQTQGMTALGGSVI